MSASRDATLRIWDLDASICTHTLLGHDATIRSLVVHGTLVISGSGDATCKIWSSATGECLRTLTGHEGSVYALAMTHDGTQVASGSLDGSVRIWDIQRGECLAVLDHHGVLVARLVVYGELLVTGAADGRLRLWSLKTWSLLYAIEAHYSGITSLQISANGDRLVSGGSDGYIKLWDVQTGQLIRGVGEPGLAVYQVAFGKGDSIFSALRREETVLEVIQPSFGFLFYHCLLTLGRSGIINVSFKGEKGFTTLLFYTTSSRPLTC